MHWKEKDKGHAPQNIGMTFFYKLYSVLHPKRYGFIFITLNLQEVLSIFMKWLYDKNWTRLLGHSACLKIWKYEYEKNIIMTNVELAKYGESPNEETYLIYGILVIS